MKIIELAYGLPDDRFPTYGIFQFDQAKALASIGNDIYYVALDFRSIKKIRMIGYKAYKKNGVNIYLLSLPIGPIPGNILSWIGMKCFSVIYKYIIQKNGAIDIIHAHFWDSALSAKHVVEMDNIPLLITEHSSDLVNEKRSKIYYKVRESYKYADKIIAVGNNLKREIKKISGIDAIVIGNIVDLNVFKYSDHIVNTNSVFRFISVGNAVYGKGFDILICSMLDLINEGYNCILEIIGDGDELGNLKNQAKEYEISKYILFSGLKNRIYLSQAFKNADAFVLASRYETFGIVYIEAMASGLPVIATKCGGPEDFVNSRNGILIDSNNREQLTCAMKKMIHCVNSYNRREISEKIAYSFSAKRIAREIENVMIEAINKKGLST